MTLCQLGLLYLGFSAFFFVLGLVPVYIRVISEVPIGSSFLLLFLFRCGFSVAGWLFYMVISIDLVLVERNAIVGKQIDASR